MTLLGQQQPSKSSINHQCLLFMPMPERGALDMLFQLCVTIGILVAEPIIYGIRDVEASVVLHLLQDPKRAQLERVLVQFQCQVFVASWTGTHHDIWQCHQSTINARPKVICNFKVVDPVCRALSDCIWPLGILGHVCIC